MPAGFPNIRHDPTKPDAQAILRQQQQQQSQPSTSLSSSERKSKYQFPIEKDDKQSKSLLSRGVDSQSVNSQASRTGLLSKMTKR